MALDTQTIFNELAGTFPEYELQYDESVPCIIVPGNGVRDICLHLRDAEPYKFDTLMCLSGVDYADGTFGVVYHLDSIALRQKLTLKVIVPQDKPNVMTVERVWRTADWHEREAYDMYGIIFDNHHDLRRILMPYDWEGHPLKKDYEVPEYYNGMKVPY